MRLALHHDSESNQWRPYEKTCHNKSNEEEGKRMVEWGEFKFYPKICARARCDYALMKFSVNKNQGGKPRSKLNSKSLSNTHI
jgi:hypothetical protein